MTSSSAAGGRGYARVSTLPVVVRLIAGVLLQHEGTGRESFEQARRLGLTKVLEALGGWATWYRREHRARPASTTA